MWVTRLIGRRIRGVGLRRGRRGLRCIPGRDFGGGDGPWLNRDLEKVCWCCNGGIQEMDERGFDEILAVGIDTLLVD